GANFGSPGGTGIGIETWDGSSFAPLLKGLEHPVDALVVSSDGGSRTLYVGGDFTLAGGVVTKRVAKWDGASWSQLGDGLGQGGGGLVRALELFDDGGGPVLYAGGDFDGHVARWDGTSWSIPGGGTNSNVRALKVFDDGDGPALYAGGQFTTAGGATARML